MSIKVLVADDSITIQKVIGIIFGGDEYSLTVVDNGTAALEKAREIDPDILLIDAQMPGMTGYEVTEAIRATPALAAKPVLILTGSFEPFDEDKSKSCGADDFIAKPFESQHIIAKVKELLERGHSRAQSAPEQAFDRATAIPDISVPSFDSPADVQKPAEPADIWGAFTTEIEPPSGAVAPPIDIPEPSFDPDVFSIISEESNTFGEVSIPPSVSPVPAAPQWGPVEENTFEFEEEEPVAPTADDQAVIDPFPAFGDIAFENAEPVQEAALSDDSAADFAVPPASFAADIASAPFAEESPAFAEAPVFEAPVFETPVFTAAPVVSDIPEPETAAVTGTPAPATAPAAVALTEEQLKAAIAGVSKDVIERIVWEVVPDLAEAMIREAIRKIKEGA